MSVRRLGRGQGTVIACSGNGCAMKSITGQVRPGDHRKWLATKGWGRGTDRGQEERPETEITVNHPRVGVYTRKLPAREGRAPTKGKDLCPSCLAADKAAAEARAAARDKQIAARDAARKARAAGKAAA